MESPIRRKGLRQWVVDLRRAAGVTTVRGGSIIAVSAVVSLVLVFGGLAWGAFVRAPGAIGLASEAVDPGEQLVVLAEASDAPDPPPASTTTSTTPAPSPMTDLPSVTIIGDSVVAGAEAVVEEVLENPTVIDGRVDRQFKHADDVANDYRSAGTLGEVVILHLGTNGAFNSATFDEVMESLAGVDRVIVLTAKVPRRWESSVNRAIAEGAERWPDVEVIDWHAIGSEHPEWFFEDQVHLNGTGMRAYAKLLADAVNS